MFAKVDVNGADAHPLFDLAEGRGAPGLLGSEGIKWNFTKFLVGRDGKVIKRYAPTDKPESLARDTSRRRRARTRTRPRCRCGARR
jgi:glutathione peroxidase